MVNAVDASQWHEAPDAERVARSAKWFLPQVGFDPSRRAGILRIVPRQLDVGLPRAHSRYSAAPFAIRWGRRCSN
jgi:hypothetical protein